MEKDVFRRVFVGKEPQNGRPVEGNASPRRDLAAVASAKRRVDQVHRLRVGDLRVKVDVLVTAPGRREKKQRRERRELRDIHFRQNGGRERERESDCFQENNRKSKKVKSFLTSILTRLSPSCVGVRHRCYFDDCVAKKKKKKRKIKVERDWAPKGKETVALARSFLNFLPTIVSLDGSFLVAARKKKSFCHFRLRGDSPTISFFFLHGDSKRKRGRRKTCLKEKEDSLNRRI